MLLWRGCLFFRVRGPERGSCRWDLNDHIGRRCGWYLTIMGTSGLVATDAGLQQQAYLARIQHQNHTSSMVACSRSKTSGQMGEVGWRKKFVPLWMFSSPVEKSHQAREMYGAGNQHRHAVNPRVQSKVCQTVIVHFPVVLRAPAPLVSRPPARPPRKLAFTWTA